MGVFLGPLGGLREVGEVQAGVQVSSSRPSSERVTLDGRRIIQRAPRVSRSWALSLGSWRDPSVAAYMSSCASGVFAGPLYLLTAHAAATNMLPANIAAPGAMGSHGLLTSAGMFPAAGTVPVNVAGQGVVPSVGVVQSASAGAWSKTVPVRQVPLVLSVWASAAGAAIEWRTVNAAGGVAQSGGVVSAAAVAGGFRGEAAFTPSATAVGVQVRLAAGSRTVGGLRLVEGVLPTSGTVTRRNLIPNPQFAVNTATWTARGGTLSAYLWTRMWEGQRGDRVQAGQLTSDGTNAYLGIEQPMTTSPVVGGKWIAVSALIAGDPQDNIGCRMDVLCSTPTGYTFHLSGAWQPAPFYAGRRITWAFQSPATTTTFGVRAQMYSGDLGTMIPAGRRLWLSDVHAATAATEAEALAQVATYFDGSTPPEPGRYITWDGTPHASASTERILPDTATLPGWLPGEGVPMVVVRDPSQAMQLALPRNHRSDYAVTIEEVG